MLSNKFKPGDRVRMGDDRKVSRGIVVEGKDIAAKNDPVPILWVQWDDYEYADWNDHSYAHWQYENQIEKE